jgi:hypothetical protein
MKPKLSAPNKKTGIVSFNINNTVCKKIPGCKAQGCLKHCYYNKIKRLYPAQTPFLNHNLKASRDKLFVPKMISLISKENCRYFRIHSCGEFYSQEYFNKWCTIAKFFPNITFYTYTKNIDLNVTRPSNFILYLSDDKGIWGDSLINFNGRAVTKEKTDPIPKGFSLCQHQLTGVKCIQCMQCMQKKNTNVCFNKH